MGVIVKTILLALLISVVVQAQNYETTIKELSFKSTNKTVIDEETIKKSQAPDVTTLLQAHANISVSSSGFQKNTLFLRGGDSSHILILINGAPIFDSGTAQRTFNLNLLSLKNIRRIEVLRGAQTVLYGGQALAGVIKIETFSKDPQDINLFKVEVGNFNYRQQSLFSQKKWGENHVLQAHVAGISKNNASPILDSKEVYPQNNLNADLAYSWKGPTDWSARVFHTEDKSFLPGATAGYKAVDTKDLSQKTKVTGASLVYRHRDSVFRPEISLTVASSSKNFAQPMNDTNVFGSEVQEVYDSLMHNARGSIHLLETEDLLVQLGASYFKETMIYKNMGVERANSYGEQRGVFSKVDYSLNEDYEIEVGGRVENTTHYKSEFTSQVGLTLFKQTRLEYASAFRTPSLFQYYGSYGNTDLKPERATSYTLTHDLSLSENQSLSVAVFQTGFSHLIATQTISGITKYYNINRAQAAGVEMLYSYSPAQDISGFLRYTYQEAKDQDTGNRLPRRPRNTASLGLSQDWSAQNAGIEVVYFGDRETPITSKTTQKLSPYTLTHLFWSLDFQERFQASVRINNLLDTRFEESYNYFGEGRFVSAGLSYIF